MSESKNEGVDDTSLERFLKRQVACARILANPY